MIKRMLHRARRFGRKEDGSASIEFVIIFPIFLWMTYSGVEVGLFAWNQAHLERGLDQTIRDVRLNNIEQYTSTPENGWDHDLLKRIVCDKALFLENCEQNMRLEMTPIDPNVGNPFEQNADGDNELARILCVDTPADVRTTEVFEPGGSDELMLVRACVEMDIQWLNFSLFGFLARSLNDNDGQYEIHATTVFVNEPV